MNRLATRTAVMTALVITAAVVILMAFITSMTVSAQGTDPQREAITGISVSTGGSPGEIDVTWDAHPAGVVDYRVAWAPTGEEFRGPNETNWNAFPTSTSLTVTGLTEESEYNVKVKAPFTSKPWFR